MEHAEWVASLQPEARKHAEQRYRNGLSALRQQEVEVYLTEEQRARWMAGMRERVRASIDRDFPDD